MPMEQSKIVKYIQELTPKSRDRFHQFVLSPYFNQHKQTTQLVEIVLCGGRHGLDDVFHGIPEGSAPQIEKKDRHFRIGQKLGINIVLF